MTEWILDAYISSNRVLLRVYREEDGSLVDQRVDLDFYGYIAGGEVERVAEELRGVDSVEDAWVEEWRSPPFYDSKVRVVVFKTRSYSALRRVQRESELRGLRVLNTFPHPLVEALHRAGVKPLTRVKYLGARRIVVEEWDPSSRDPVLEYAVLGFSEGYFTVETPSETQRFWSVRETAEYVASRKLHIGFADPYVYAKLVETEPRVATSAYKWVTGGAFSPHEYFEWSRLSYTPLSLMSNVTIGRILTTIEALHARRLRMLIDKSKSRRESWRSLRELVEFDRGGVVYQPKPGLYWCVCQVDFKSLYPSIIVEYNVSGETVNKPTCSNTLTPDWTLHGICLDEEGVVPASIRELIELKDLYDELYKKTGVRVYSERKSAVKWILVASFGYLGYRNSLFGSVSAHEVVTSTSREVMRRARLAVEREGFRVVHAIVDSVFIAGVKSTSECLVLKERVEEATGFRAKVEAHYVWLYIPRSLSSSRGVANKYYGLLSDNTWKVKGVLAVHRDTPPLVKRAQLEALAILFKAKTPGELAERVLEARSVIDKYVELLEARRVDPRDLVVSRSSRVRGEYKKPPLYAQLSSAPYRLIYVQGKLTPLHENTPVNYDVDKYIDLLEKARRELPDVSDVFKNTY